MKNNWFGEVKRWKDGNRLYAKNDFCTLVFVATDDPKKIGQLGLDGPDQMVVKFISTEQAKAWNNCNIS